MKKYLSLGVLIFMGILSIYFYYFFYPIHGENRAFFFIYLTITSIIYGIYKLIGSLTHEVKTKITPVKLILFFLLQLFIVCICFFAFTVGNMSYGFVLFFKILFLFIPVSLLWINFYCLGDTILKYFRYFGLENKSIQITSSIGVGFTIFMFLLFLSISLGRYNATSIGIIFVVFIIAGYQNWLNVFRNMNKTLKTYSHNLRLGAPISEKVNISLIIDEFHYIIVTFLISVNLVSIYRPFPIGWDDLGAYMNYPKLLSGAGEHLALGKMYLWELYTGIGFLFGSQTLAFYLNSFSGIIAAIVIYFSISSIVKKKETGFDLGLFGAMIILMMPMVIFQLAKDMKLDLGLLSISVIAISLFYTVIFSDNKGKNNLYLYGLIGVFIGIAFAIKLTSLLLLLGVFGALFYKRYSLGGFIGFIGMFIGIFSYLNLWGMMNVLISSESQNLKIFSVLSMFFGLSIFLGNHILKKHKKQEIFQLSSQVGVILLGFIIALLPWGIKHIVEIPREKTMNVSSLISGYSDRYRSDYSIIYSKSELLEKNTVFSKGVGENGITSNEDFGRYFGYEEGINNYLKLPWNLSFQTNQGGEFTDITYIFFALIPALFLFLPYKREYYKYPIIGAILLALIFFIPNSISIYFTEIFSKIILPGGYLILGIILLIPLIYFHFTLDTTNKISRIFLVNFTFSTIYIGLWTVSAFGIVWYGILMYVLFLFMITLCMLAMQESSTKYHIGNYIVLGVVWIYIFQSVIPHGITNLRSAGYPDYKLGGMSEEVALMTFHPEYFTILFELNIDDEYKEDLFITYRNKILSIVDDTEFAQGIIPQIQILENISNLHDILRQLNKFDLKNVQANNAISDLLQGLYEDILYTKKDIKNMQNIFRTGTFLKYYISENNTRLFEDSLLTKFDNFFYDIDFDLSIERIKKMNLGYILLDLNAATIDNDPSKSLTARYENMLKLATHSDLELIDTDSICLRVALDTYKINNDIPKYLDIAGINYSNKKSSDEKKSICVREIVEILGDEEKLKKYPYLASYIPSLENANIPLNDSTAVGEALFQSIRNGYKVLFKIK